MTVKPTKHPLTFTDWLRVHTSNLTNTLGMRLHRAGVHPNTVSIAGFVVVVLGTLVVMRGWLVVGGVLIALGALCDALDGAVARARGGNNPFGAVLDSTLDRYADGFIFASLGYYFAIQNQVELMLLPLAALMGSYAVSYVRARADGPDVSVPVKVGLFSRVERIAMVVLMLWLHQWLLVPGLWLLAIGTNITALQRLWYVHRKV